MRTNAESSVWTPPHCPNPKCSYHSHLTGPWPFSRRGHYTRKSDRARIPRAQCRTCGVTFSSQSFSADYWLKRRDLLPRIFMRAVGGMCNRQIARDLRCSPETVHRLLARLGRHCLLLHMEIWGERPPNGPIVVDGFESFEYSQYYPMHHHLAVEAETGFWIYHTDSELRRKGRMTPRQKRRRAELEKKHGRPDPQSIRKDMAELLRVSLANVGSATVRSDDHRSYPAAVRSVPCRVRHEVTSSRRPRTSRNPLFEINLLDLLIRHSQAKHRRETIAWGKRRQASAERLAILQVWRNYVKRRWEKGPIETPAMLKGLLPAPLTVAEVFARRMFPGRLELPPRWKEYYRRRVTTRALPRNRLHDLKYAF